MTIGIRGAITVENNSKEDIVSSTSELLKKMTEENRLNKEDIAAVIFSTTKDLDAEFPAAAARELGWNSAALMCTNEISVKGAIKKCVRVLMIVNSEIKQSEVKHVYLKEARSLRPDLG